MVYSEKQKLIKLFFTGKPHTLAYNYRRKGDLYKEHKSILDELIKEGLVEQIEKTNTKIIFQYNGPAEATKIKQEPVTKSKHTPDVLAFKKEEIAKFLDAHPDATLKDIFQFIPRTTIAIDTNIHKSRIASKAENPNLFRLQEIIAISKYLNMPVERILKLMLASMPENSSISKE
jgi:hypothetical protein